MANTYYVSKLGSDDNDGLGPEPSHAWLTVNKANTTLTAGDIVHILEGIYIENNSQSVIRPSNTGSENSYITYKNYQGQKVVIGGYYQPICLWTVNYIWIEGIDIRGDLGALTTEYGVRINGNYNVIKNCYIHEILYGASSYDRGIWIQTGCHHNKVQNCELKRGGNNDNIGDGIWIDTGAYSNLVENCDVDFWGHLGIHSWGQKNIIRNNTVRGSWGPTIGLANDDHATASRILVQGNRCWDNNWSGDHGGAGWPWEATGSSAYKDIWRRNLIYFAHGVGHHYLGTATLLGGYGRFYNNVIYDVGRDAKVGENKPFKVSAFDAEPNCTAIVFKNNLLYGNNADGTVWNEFANENNHTFLNNWWNANGDPKYVAPGDLLTSNFHLKGDSPCINAGGWLTTITSANGSGMSFVVADAGYFCDGFGIVDGDYIRIQGQKTRRKITAVDYGTNTITIDEAVSWTQGDGVAA